MKQNVEYLSDGLVIHFSCSDPAATHAALMRAIAANVACLVQCPLKTDVEPLVSLLQVILPDERVLERANKAQ